MATCWIIFHNKALSAPTSPSSDSLNFVLPFLTQLLKNGLSSLSSSFLLSFYWLTLVRSLPLTSSQHSTETAPVTFPTDPFTAKSRCLFLVLMLFVLFDLSLVFDIVNHFFLLEIRLLGVHSWFSFYLCPPPSPTPVSFGDFFPISPIRRKSQSLDFFLFLLTFSFSNSVWSYGLQYNLFADDSQSDVSSLDIFPEHLIWYLIASLTSALGCLIAFHTYRIWNFEFLLIPVPPAVLLVLGNDESIFSCSGQNRGVFLLFSHISSSVSKSFRLFFRIYPDSDYFSTPPLLSCISYLDFCSSLLRDLFDFAPNFFLSISATEVALKYKSNNVSPLLKTLQWLPSHSELMPEFSQWSASSV